MRGFLRRVLRLKQLADNVMVNIMKANSETFGEAGIYSIYTKYLDFLSNFIIP